MFFPVDPVLSSAMENKANNELRYTRIFHCSILLTTTKIQTNNK